MGGLNDVTARTLSTFAMARLDNERTRFIHRLSSCVHFLLVSRFRGMMKRAAMFFEVKKKLFIYVYYPQPCPCSAVHISKAVIRLHCSRAIPLGDMMVSPLKVLFCISRIFVPPDILSSGVPSLLSTHSHENTSNIVSRKISLKRSRIPPQL